MFELVGRAVAEGRVAALEVEVGVKVVSYFQAGFFEGGKSSAVGQQFGFDGALARLRLGRTR